MTESWKKWFWRSAGFGAGFAILLVMLIGGWAWYISRPARPKPWNTKAIKASYDELSAQNTDKDIQAYFGYILENDTDTDYKISDSVKIMSRNSHDALDDIGTWIRFDNFVPAHQKAKVGFTVMVGDIFDSAKAKDNDKELIHTVGSWVSGIKSFVVFDEENRYEIELPSGWSPYVDISAGLVPKDSVKKAPESPPQPRRQ